MPLRAWIMLVVGAVFLGGGLTVCLIIACKKRPRPAPEADDSADAAQ